jgi:transcriptional regulator with XRE-family HTH domain
MTMARDANDIIAALPPARRAKIEARAAELIAEELSLQALRKAMSRTQTQMARKLRMRQDSVSRLEQRTDLLLSTLRGYVKALGGELHLVAEFPGRPPVRLRKIGTLAEPHKAPTRSHTHKRSARSTTQRA